MVALHLQLNWPLVSAAAAIGLAGGVHCVAMCASPAALAAQGRAVLPFQAGRVAGYAVLGLAAALGAAALGSAAGAAAWLRPLWLMAHVAILLLGGWMLATGRHPAWLQQGLLNAARGLAERTGGGTWRMAAPAAALAGAVAGTGTPVVEIRLPARIGRQPPPWRVVARGFATGMAWALLPCGLLYSALMLAWMSGSALTGAAAMAAFALVSGGQLWLGQRGLLALLRAGREQTAVRLAGAVTLAGAALLLWWAATGHAPEGFCLPGF